MATSNQVDAADLICLLESTDIKTVTEIQTLVIENLQKGKEAWLLNGLVDSYVVSQSQKVLEILSNIHEPHDKHLFDRLVDHLKSNNKLQALSLLGQVVRKQPSWLHKIVKHSLLSQMFKTMKLDTDVKVLMSGVLIITMLLPNMPCSIAPHLQDIFDIFTRLVSFNRRKPGDVPDVYLLHLQVGVYCLFHRLYGMYPCNFLTYLRQIYSKPDQRQTFQEIVQPMLETVRMHPLLILTSKDKEVSVDRWKRKEVHDILVECAKLSLDLNEGVREDGEKSYTSKSTSKHTLLSNINKYDPFIMFPKQFTSDASAQSVKVEPVNPIGEKALMSAEQMNKFWSPSLACGLSTPPPASSTQTFELPPSGHPQGHLVAPENTPVTSVTPSTMGESPYPPSSAEKTRSAQPTPHDEHIDSKNDKLFQTPDQRPTHLNKRLSNVSLSLAGKVPDANIPEDSGSVPPSPLKPDFTNDPPFHTHKSQVIRKISFDVASLNESKATGATTNGKEPVKVMETDAVSSVAPRESRSGSIPSVNQLPQFIDSLDVHSDNPDRDEDEEVSEITGDAGVSSDSESDGHPSHLPSSVELTTESVKAFMKKVNRIKFNSMTVQRDVKPKTKETVARATSCPDLAEVDCQATDDKEASTTTTPSSVRSRSSTNPENAQPVSVVTTSATVTQVSVTTTTAVQIDPEIILSIQEEEQKKIEYEAKYPYIQLIPEVLPFLPRIPAPSVDAGAASLTQEMKDKLFALEPNDPLFTKFSPADLLDRHIQLGSDVHAKELSHIPLTSSGTVSWTHFGGVPPADEVNILRGQSSLLHNQLLFERHKRELHAQRNRRLLGRIVKTTALEEQASAMSDQLRLQENEMQNLKISLKLQQEENRVLKVAKETFESEREKNQRTARQEMENLEKQNKNLRNDLETEKKTCETITKELKTTKAKLFEMEKELESMQIKASRAQGLQQQVQRLNKELLLMGELQHRYQQRLGEVTKSHDAQPQAQLFIDALKLELTDANLISDQRLAALEMTKGKLTEAEEILKQKDTILAEHKRLHDEQKFINKGFTQSLEEKYNSQKSIQLTLQAQILELENKISRLQRPVPGEISAPSSDEQVRRHTITVSPSRTSVSSAELADEATAIDSSSPTGSLSRSTSSAFRTYQRSSAQNTSEEEQNTSSTSDVTRPSSSQVK